jgi:hypothetical protein
MEKDTMTLQEAIQFEIEYPARELRIWDLKAALEFEARRAKEDRECQNAS